MSFIKDVWGGHDYIPLVWDQWLTDPSGKMFVVEAGGKVVGMNRVRFLEDGSAWFEGARVHPAYRGRGLASMLGENSMKVAAGRGVSVFRLTSGSTNRTAHRQIARIGFKESARFSVYEPRKGMRLRPGSGAKKASPEELRAILLTLRGTREFHLGAGVSWHDFNAAALSPEVVAKRIREGAVWRSGRALALVREGGEGTGRWEEVGFLGGPVEDASRLVEALVGRNKQASERYVFVPQGSPIIHLLRMKGFVRNFSMILFERRAANG
jgi:GNAT superfamily N-acetyltransferase